MRKKLLLGLLLPTLLAGSFLAGFRNGLYKLFPYGAYKAIQKEFSNNSSSSPPGFRNDREILDIAFTDPLNESDNPLFQETNSIDSIHEKLESLYVPVENFDHFYEDITITSSSTQQTTPNTWIHSIKYNLAGKEYSAYAYFRKNESKNENGFLLIPGSGLNQSSAIYHRDRTNYQHGILDLLGQYGEVFVLVKPNEDFLAIHNGRNKLNYNFIINHLLNRGGSYSALYIAHSLAFSKFIKTKYETTGVVGLSQGGGAAFLNALQSEPDIAIISSGFSFLFDKMQAGSHDQIIIPCKCFAKYTEVDFVRQKISNLKTKFLFSWGKGESDYYKYEAFTQYSCSLLNLPNTECILHDMGHVYPVEEIKDYMEKMGI